MPREPGSRIRDFNVEPSDNQHGPQAVEPHSEWQLLIERTRSEKKLSIREVASKSNIPSGTLYNWVRAKKGAPSRSIYTASANKRLAHALQIDENELAEAYNRSAFNPVDPNQPDPPPRPAPRASGEDPRRIIGELVAALRKTKRSTFTIDEIELVASTL